jgi:hypothetical protein
MAHYRGKVSGYTPRSETGVFRRRQTLVWDFRLERQEQGRPLPRLAVQMRAKYYRGGAVNNGDIVEISGRPGRNGVVVVQSVKNLTSGTKIQAHNWNLSVFLLNGVMLVLFLAFVAGVGAVFLSAANDSFHP